MKSGVSIKGSSTICYLAADGNGMATARPVLSLSKWCLRLVGVMGMNRMSQRVIFLVAFALKSLPPGGTTAGC